MKLAKKNELYMDDHPVFRFGMGGLLVFVRLFGYLWRYLLCPISHIYVSTIKLTPGYYILSIVWTVVFCVGLLYLMFIPLNKSWKPITALGIADGGISLVGYILFMIEEYSYMSGEYEFSNYLSLRLPIIFIDILCVVPFILLLTSRRASKYVFIIFFFLVLLSGAGTFITSLIDYINTLLYGNVGWCSISGIVLDDSEEKYFFLTSAISSFPSIHLYWLLFGLFIRVRKDQSGEFSFAGYQNEYPQIVVDDPFRNQRGYGNSEATASQQNSQPEIRISAPQFIPTEKRTDFASVKPHEEESADKPVFCGYCGHKLSADFDFCVMCGNKL